MPANGRIVAWQAGRREGAIVKTGPYFRLDRIARDLVPVWAPPDPGRRA